VLAQLSLFALQIDTSTVTFLMAKQDIPENGKIPLAALKQRFVIF